MKRILVNYLGRKGGAPIYSYEMTKGLLNNGCEVYAIIPSTIDNLQDWKKLPLKKLVIINTYNSSITFLTGLLRFYLFDSIRIKKYFKGIKIDVCYIPMIQPWSELINRLFPNSRKIVTLHDPKPHEGSGRIMNYLYRRVVKNADDIVLLSDSFIEYTKEEYGISDDQIFVIPHGVFDYYGRFESENIYRANKINFLFFGRIAPYKGLELLAEAYNKLFEKNNDISLFVVGSGDFSKYDKLFKTENNTTIINEFIDDNKVVSYFRGNNIVTVLPYIDATQSGVIPIAMKERSLLIVSNTGGLLEQTDNGRLAVICEPTADSLYQAMERVTYNYEEFDEMIDNAQAYIESLDWNSLSSRLVDIMENNK